MQRDILFSKSNLCGNIYFLENSSLTHPHLRTTNGFLVVNTVNYIPSKGRIATTFPRQNTCKSPESASQSWERHLQTWVCKTYQHLDSYGDLAKLSKFDARQSLISNKVQSKYTKVPTDSPPLLLFDEPWEHLTSAPPSPPMAWRAHSSLEMRGAGGGWRWGGPEGTAGGCSTWLQGREHTVIFSDHHHFSLTFRSTCQRCSRGVTVVHGGAARGTHGKSQHKAFRLHFWRALCTHGAQCSQTTWHTAAFASSLSPRQAILKL